MIELKTLLVLLFFLTLEIAILFFLVISLVNQKIYYYIQTIRYHRMRVRMTTKIIDYLERPRSFIPDKIFNQPFELLSVMETFNHRLKGGEWEELKKAIAAHYLLPKARKRAKSWFWRKRNFAARVFSVMPLVQDQALILALIRDSVFLVRSIASIAAVELNLKEGVEQTLLYMAQEFRYARCFYRDILLQGSVQTFSTIADIASKSRDPAIHLASLELFAGNTVTCPLPILQQDLESPDAEIRRNAVKALIQNPLKESEKILLAHLKDPDEEVRAEAALGLSHFMHPQTFSILNNLLKDPSWKVKLKAATALKRMGNKGMAILKKQDRVENKLAYEVARYAMDFLD